jgi:hypothetical protein
VPSRQIQVVYHHLGNNNAPAMYRTGGACAAVATGMEQELEATAMLEQDAAAVNAHFERVTLQLKRAYLQGTVPDGDSDKLGFPGFERDEVNGWVLGNHLRQTTEQARLFKEMLVSHRHCFAYTMEDLPGYNGSVGLLTFPSLTTGDIVRKPCRHSAVECNIIDEKCRELEVLGFIVKCPKPWTHVQNIVVAVKKDLDGNWTESLMCIDYRPINAETKASH